MRKSGSNGPPPASSSREAAEALYQESKAALIRAESSLSTEAPSPGLNLNSFQSPFPVPAINHLPQDNESCRDSVSCASPRASPRVSSAQTINVQVCVRCRPVSKKNRFDKLEYEIIPPSNLGSGTATSSSTNITCLDGVVCGIDGAPSPADKSVSSSNLDGGLHKNRSMSSLSGSGGASTSAGERTTIRIHDHKYNIKGPKSYKYDKVFGEETGQEEVFEAVSPIIDRVMEGYNGTVFAYGVTGSGKTYTMMGPSESATNESLEGVIPRSARRIFEYIAANSENGEVFAVTSSMVEIYSPDGRRETIYDLLSKDDYGMPEIVKLHEGKDKVFHMHGLSQRAISSPDQIRDLLHIGQKQQHTLETTSNTASTRAHCVFMLTIEMKKADESRVRQGTLMLVDLAGSESLKKVHAKHDDQEDLRQRQAIGINRVLTSLGTCVNNINQGDFVNYRDSALTMLLKNSLGGNARSLLIAQVIPEEKYSDELVKTLKFAHVMSTVENKARVNRVTADKSFLVRMQNRQESLLKAMRDKVQRGESSQREVARRELKNFKNFTKQVTSIIYT